MKNNADLKIMLREAGILFAITLIAGIVLGVINELTKDPIRVQQEKAVQEACQTVFTQAESFEEFEMALEPEEDCLLCTRKDDQGACSTEGRDEHHWDAKGF